MVTSVCEPKPIENGTEVTFYSLGKINRTPGRVVGHRVKYDYLVEEADGERHWSASVRPKDDDDY